MANQDSFIDEVTEEVRRDRLFALFRRYGWIGITLVVLLVAGAAFFEWRKAQARAEAEARGDAILAVLESESPAARAAGLEALTGEGEAAGRAQPVIGLLAAAEMAATGDPADGIAQLDALAARSDIPAIYRDLATLKSAMIGAGTMAPADRLTRLEPLTAPGGAFRALALEQMALARIEAGETEAALQILTTLLGDADASEGLRRRASQLIVALGGSLDAS